MSLRSILVLLPILLATACGGGGGGGGGSRADGPSVAGTATLPQGLAVDGDVNDPNTRFSSNDDPVNAQPIPNPVTLTGFASAVPFGQPSSRFSDRADFFDGYRVDLAEGQAIALTIGNWDEADRTAVDLDIFLFDLDLNVVASSEGIDRDELIVVPASGSYLILVEALTGASTYELSLGAELSAADLRRPRWNRADDFVPAEAIVRLAAGAAAPGATASALGGRRTLAGRPGMPMLVALGGDGPTARAAAAGERAIDPWSGRALSAEEAARARTLRELKSLAASPAVANAGPNYRLGASAVPNDRFYPLQWHYPAIQLPAAWDITRGARAGQPVIVAVVDTGVLTQHPDLVGQLVDGFDFVSDATRALDGDGIDADATDPGDRDFGGASSWHGTHVAGTIAAASDNGSGVAGVAGDARVMPVRVLGRGGGTAFDILHGLRYAAGLDNVSSQRPAQAADIINLSLGGPAFVPEMQDAVNQARAAGVIVVAAAGNEASQRTSFPAGYDGVISVSAVDIANRRSDFSNFGTAIDVAAPGGSGSASDANADGYPDNILSTHADDTGAEPQPTFGFLNGTSMAAPHVAGVLALMRAVDADITPAEVDTLLGSGQLTDDLGSVGRDDDFGHGLINAYKAVVAARNLAGGGALPPVLSAAPARIDFGTGSANRTLRLENQGDGVLDVSAVTASDDWIVVSDGNSVNGGLEFQISVDRRGLPSGAYGGRLTIASNIGSHTVPVTMLVAAAGVSSDVGRVYFLLLDPESDESLAQVDAAASNGRYSFRFDGVEAGEYFLVAGSDLDNDDFICGPGESCGAWPVASAPDLLTVGADDVAGLSMSLGSGGALRGSAASTMPQRGYRLLKPNPGGAR